MYYYDITVDAAVADLEFKLLTGGLRTDRTCLANQDANRARYGNPYVRCFTCTDATARTAVRTQAARICTNTHLHAHTAHTHTRIIVTHAYVYVPFEIGFQVQVLSSRCDRTRRRLVDSILIPGASDLHIVLY